MASQGGFQFVSSTGRGNSRAHKRLVRSHAARDPLARKKKVSDYQRRGSDKDSCEVEELVPYPMNRREHPFYLEAVAQRRGISSITSQVGMPAVDPFQSFSRPVSTIEWSLIYHFVSKLSLGTGSISLKDEDVASPALMLSHWMQMAAADAGMLACVLLGACRDLSRCGGTLQVRVKSVAMAAQFSILAIRSLRQDIESRGETVTDVTILKAMAIGLDSAITQDFGAVMAHVEALWRMVELRGGFDALRSEGAMTKMSVWALHDQTLTPRRYLPLSCVERMSLEVDQPVGS